MATIVLFHSVLGLRPIELSTAGRLRARGHNVYVPDLFGGRTAMTLDEGFATMDEIGWSQICDRARVALSDAPATAVLIGFSMGVGVISSIWPERPKAAGIVLLHGLAAMPADIGRSMPIQAHIADPDPFVPAHQLQEWLRPGEASPELYLYPSLGHFFTDPSLEDFNERGADLAWDRIERFLDMVSA